MDKRMLFAFAIGSLLATIFISAALDITSYVSLASFVVFLMLALFWEDDKDS